jgi:Asp-tRNA(Asn)/Glu-tRNA(Gln) amidotransferase A subunit family amidase
MLAFCIPFAAGLKGKSLKSGGMKRPSTSDASRRFVELKVGGDCLQATAVAVSSRAGIIPSSDFPLRGFRIAVKDIFEVENVRTSVCNRAYYELYPPPKKTAACVDILISAGAEIVGTTKLASFAATEEPVECIDYQAPWNPRADGYQSPAGSSSGSGAAVAAYEWLDITIGSDSEHNNN